MSVLLRGSVLCLFALVSGCIEANFAAAGSECQSTDDCAAGQVCLRSVCVAPGSGWDGGPVKPDPTLDAGTQPGPDAGSQPGSDGGPGADVVVGSDAGSTADAGGGEDAGAQADAGGRVDAGAPAVPGEVQCALEISAHVTGDRQFLLCGEGVFIAEARRRCRAAGHELATVPDGATNAALTHAAMTNEVTGTSSDHRHRWIGLSRQNNAWVWDTGEPLGDYHPWSGDCGDDCIAEREERGQVTILASEHVGEWYAPGPPGRYGFFCEAGQEPLAAPDGLSADTAAVDCSSLLRDRPETESGIFWIDSDGDDGFDPFRAHCDMETDGGGWTVMKRWGSGENYSNSLFMARHNSMGKSGMPQGSPDDVTHALPYVGSLLQGNQVMMGWSFQTQDRVEHPNGYVIWGTTLAGFNGGLDTDNHCNNDGFWQRSQGGCEYSNGGGMLLRQSREFELGHWLVGDLEGTSPDYCTSIAWDDDGSANQGGGGLNILCSGYDTGSIWFAVRSGPVCGNDIVEPGEDCEDGNQDDADGCSNDCEFNLTLAEDCHDNRQESRSWVTGDRMFWLCHVDRAHLRKNWAEAGVQCDAWGGYLATVSNAEEAAAIQNNGTAFGVPHTYYLGGIYENGGWRWANGEAVGWQLPEAANGQCLWLQGEYRATDCNNQVGFICEFGPAPEQAAAPDGLSADTAAFDCSSLLSDWPATESGTYWIDPDGRGGDAAVETECEMETAGGGWSQVIWVERGATTWNAWTDSRNEQAGNEQRATGLPISAFSAREDGEDLSYMIKVDGVVQHYLYADLNGPGAWNPNFAETGAAPFDTDMAYRTVAGAWGSSCQADLRHNSSEWNWSLCSAFWDGCGIQGGIGFCVNGVDGAEETAGLTYGPLDRNSRDWGGLEVFVRRTRNED